MTAINIIYKISYIEILNREQFDGDDEYKQESINSEMTFKRFLIPLIDFISSFTVFQDDKEKILILQACFQILAKIYSLSELLEVQYLRILIQLIINCQMPLKYIFLYSQRFEDWQRQKKELALEEMSSEDEKEKEEIDSFIPWNFIGIGVFIYLVFIKKIEIESFQFHIFSNGYLFILFRPYIQTLLTSHLTLMGKDIARKVLKKISTGSIQNIDKTVHLYFDFIQILINFMVTTPQDKERTDAFNILNDLFSKFENSSRYELLSHTLKTCPFESFTGLMLHKMKEEIRSEYDAYLIKINHQINPKAPYEPNNENRPPLVTMDKETIIQLNLMSKNSFFLRKESLLLVFETIKRFGEPSVNTADLLLEAFNLIYWILLRDFNANVTGIRNKEILKELSENIIKPLQLKIDDTLKSIDKVLEEKKEFDKLVEQELDNLEEEFDKSLIEDDEEDLQIQRDTTNCRLNLWILQDLLSKILVIISQK